MSRHIHLIAIEHTYAGAGCQIVRISVTGTKENVTPAVFTDLAIAIYGQIASENRMLATRSWVGEISEPTPVHIAEGPGFSYDGPPMHTLVGDIFLTEGRLNALWLPYDVDDIDSKRDTQDAEWNRLVLDSVWVWVLLNLDKGGLAAGYIYVGDNIYTSLSLAQVCGTAPASDTAISSE